MQVNKNNITQFLTSTNMCFMIPVYQRNYDWQEENCKQLWTDIWYVSQSPNDRTHFLGTICSKTVNGHEKTIIDGQQRITTITLLIKAMHDYVDNDAFKRDLDSNFIHNNGYGVAPNHRVKLHLNRRDDAIYNKLLDSSYYVEPDSLGSDEAKSRVYQNYDFFYRRVQGCTEEQVAEIRAALDRIVIVDLDVESENPQEIFESLNSTGLDLTDVDLLRNYLLMSLDHDTQVRLYDNYWYKIEQNVSPDNMVRFFVDYLIFIKKSDSITIRGRRQHINENNLYTSFKDYYQALAGGVERYQSNPKVTENILDSMLGYSKAYRRLVFRDNVDMNKLGPIDRTIYSIVRLNQAVASRPVLLYIIDKHLSGAIDSDQALTMLNACLSLVVRAKVSGAIGINGQFAGNMLQKLPSEDMSNVVDSFWKAITSGSGRYTFPSDNSFTNSLLTRPVFDVLRSKGTKYLLYAIEQGSPSSKGLPRYDDPNITIEHIMPKTLSEEWADYLEEEVAYHDDYLNKLGNLTLTSNNSEMSNKVFDGKQDWYRESSFYFTRRLGDYENWSIDQIRIRGAALAEQCVKTWPIPVEYQGASVEASQSKRRPPFKFSMVGLEEGDEIYFTNDPSKIAVVEDDSHVTYDGKTYSLSRLAALLMDKDSSFGVAGPQFLRLR